MEYLKSRRKKKKRLSLKNYKIITDFSVVSEKDCTDADKYNNKIYRNALTDIHNAIKLIESNGLSANISVPTPPTPNNHKKFLLWMKRSVIKPVILQSHATLYLKDKGFIINKDYEAYQAIEFANEHRIQNDLEPFGEQYLIKQKNNFSNVYSNTDQNVLRHRLVFHNPLDNLNLNNSYENYKQSNISQQHFQPLEQNNPYSTSHSYPPSSIHYPPVPNHQMNPIVPTTPTNSYNIYPVLPTAPPMYHAPLVNREIKPNTDATNTDNNRTTLTEQADLTHNSRVSQDDDVHSVSNLVLNPHVIDRVNIINENDLDL